MELFKQDVNSSTSSEERLTQSQKDMNDKEWYKEKVKHLLERSAMGRDGNFFNGNSRWKNKKINYDLFNNIINLNDFKHVYNPFGEGVGSMPANFTNRDIVSSKIKVLIGMESDMPFSWKAVAVNEEATTRREQEEFGQIKDFVVNTILQPIKEQITQQEQEASQGRQLTPDETKKLQQQIADELQSKTPDEVRKYMTREHQDPAEVLIQQILEYLTQKERLAAKFNKGWKHAMLSAEEVYWIGIVNGNPVMRVINPIRFDCDRSHDSDFIEDGEWATCEYRMTPTEIIKQFGSELKDEEIDEIYKFYSSPNSPIEQDFTFRHDEEEDNTYTLRVVHANWIGLKKIGFLTYNDSRTGQPEMKIMPDWYKLNKEAGDIKIEWEWIPEAHEAWLIGADIYAYCRPVPGQHRDPDNLYNSKLSYYGASLDSLNSIPTSPMDRIKTYQYFYDIIFYRIEMLLASDKGKILMMNINAIPKSSGIDIKHFMYFLEANKIGFFNPNEEGNRGAADAGSVAKEIDMSLANNIQQYIQMAEYIERRCGETIGVTKAMEGMTSPTEPVANNRQNMIQASYILRPYFDIHNQVKANALQALVDIAKVAYAGGKQTVLSYVLDDLSIQQLKVDGFLLDSSTFGLFVANSSNAYEAKQMVMQLAQAALQNQRADITDVINVMRSDSIQQASEILEAAQDKKDMQAQQAQESQQQSQAQQSELERAHEESIFEHEKQLIIVKEEERRKTELQKQAMLSLGFSDDKDVDNDGTPDVFEVYKEGLRAKFTERKQALEEAKFDHQRSTDKKKLQQTDEKLSIDKKKASQKGSTSK